MSEAITYQTNIAANKDNVMPSLMTEAKYNGDEINFAFTQSSGVGQQKPNGESSVVSRNGLHEDSPWSRAPNEIGSPWGGSREAFQSGDRLSSIFQIGAVEDLPVLSKGTNGLVWGSNEMPEKASESWEMGKSESLDFTNNGGFGPIMKLDCWGGLISLGHSNDGWPVTDNATISNANKSALQRESPLMNGWGEVKAPDPIGPQHRRSSSVSSDSPRADSTGMDEKHFRSTQSLPEGSSSQPAGDGKDERSQLDGAELAAAAQLNRDLLIAKLVNSNEGWGRKPIRQDVPWATAELDRPPVTIATPNVAADAAKTAQQPAINGMFWNDPPAKEQPYWNKDPGAGAGGSDYTGYDSIGTWGEQQASRPPPPSQWQVPPPSLGSRGVGSDAMGGFRNTIGGVGIIGGGAMVNDALAKDLLERARISNAPASLDLNALAAMRPPWSVPPSATPIPGGSGGSMWGDAQQGQFQPGGTAQDSFAEKIGHWDPSGTGADAVIGHWGQPPQTQAKVNGPFGGQPNVQLAPGNIPTIQQLMELGLGRDEALLLQRNAAGKVNDLLGGSRGMTEPQKGRMLRGGSAQPHLPPPFNSFNAPNLPQFPSYPPGGGASRPPNGQMNLSGGSFASGGNLQGRGGASLSVLQQLMQQGLPPPLDAMPPLGGGGGGGVGASVLYLQSELQPLLQRRSQVQQNAMMTKQMKQQLMDPLNQRIAAIKLQLDHCQAPPPSDYGGHVGGGYGGMGVSPGRSGRMDQFGGGGAGFRQQMLGGTGSKQDQMMKTLTELSLLGDDALTAQIIAQLKGSDLDVGAFLGGAHNHTMKYGEEAASQGLWGGGPAGDGNAGLLARSTTSAFGVPPPLSSPTVATGSYLGGDPWNCLTPSLAVGGGGSSKFAWPPTGAMAGGRDGGRADGGGASGQGWGSTPAGGSVWDGAGQMGVGSGLGGQGSAAQTQWVYLKNLTPQMDGAIVQSLCEQAAPLSMLLFNQAVGQALACYSGRDEAARAERAITSLCRSTGLAVGAELTTSDAVVRLVDGAQNKAQWTRLGAAGGLG